jgi:para-nitrobenzyl esterase
MSKLSSAILAWAISALGPTLAPAAEQQTVVVRSPAGSVEGVVEQGLQIFRGIPYAKAPVGNLRWRPPMPMDPWPQLRNAHAFGPLCPQVQEPGTSEPLPPMSEDCLLLNIWTPAADSAHRPVMVFIHGGAFMEGGAIPDYNGEDLAHRGVVYVNFQYRIGSLGFLELADIAGDRLAESGNVGLLDQIAALKWVRANIAAFGGDPDNVTVFGESAGAVSVANLLAVEASRGLFARALLESPRAPYTVSRERATRLAKQELKLAGVHTPEELERLSWQQLMHAQEELFHARFEDTSFSPIVDGVVIHQPAQLQLIRGAGARVPVVLGTNLEELKFWEVEEGLPLSHFAPGAVAAHLRPLLGGTAEQVVDHYVRANPWHTQGDGIVMLLSDLTFRLPLLRVAEAISARQPTWVYLFSYQGGPDGAGHSAEVPYVFGVGPLGTLGTEQQRNQLKEQIQATWVAFARSGNPDHAGLPHWPRYDVPTRATLNIDLTSRIEADPFGTLRQSWQAVPFDGLKPDIEQASGLMTIGGGGKYWRWTESDQ